MSKMPPLPHIIHHHQRINKNEKFKFNGETICYVIPNIFEDSLEAFSLDGSVFNPEK